MRIRNTFKKYLLNCLAPVAGAVLISGCSTMVQGSGTTESGSQNSPLNWKVPSFTYHDQNNEPFGLSNLHGKVWIADVMFTRCISVCPITTANMVKLEKDLLAKGLNVQVVSFSVDPNDDRPAVLKEYAKTHGAAYSNWHFLTGYNSKTIETFALNAFKSYVEVPKNADQATHSTDFYVVNGNGQVVDVVNGVNPSYSTVVQDVTKLNNG